MFKELTSQKKGLGSNEAKKEENLKNETIVSPFDVKLVNCAEERKPPKKKESKFSKDLKSIYT